MALIEHPWTIWIFAAVIAGLLELLVPSFTFSFVSIGAVAAAISSLWVGGTYQVMVFAVMTVVSLFLVRPLLLRKFQVPKAMHTRAHRLLEHPGEVTETIDSAKGTGRIHVHGEDWAARAENALPVGSKVQIIGVDGIVLLVKEV